MEKDTIQPNYMILENDINFKDELLERGIIIKDELLQNKEITLRQLVQKLYDTKKVDMDEMRDIFLKTLKHKNIYKKKYITEIMDEANHDELDLLTNQIKERIKQQMK